MQQYALNPILLKCDFGHDPLDYLQFAAGEKKVVKTKRLLLRGLDYRLTCEIHVVDLVRMCTPMQTF